MPECWHTDCSSDWCELRPGSNFEVPNFRPFTGPSRFPLATGKSKKLYQGAVAEAFIRADLSLDAGETRPPGGWDQAHADRAYAAFLRLIVRKECR